MFPILLVDDESADLLLMEELFRQCRILNPIHRIQTGAECVQYFEAKAERCLLFLDLAMHPMNGLDVLREIARKEIAEKSVKVMVSGISDIKMMRQAYQLGAETFLIKPLTEVDVLGLLAMVDERIEVEKTPAGRVLKWVEEDVKRKRVWLGSTVVG